MDSDIRQLTMRRQIETKNEYASLQTGDLILIEFVQPEKGAVTFVGMVLDLLIDRYDEVQKKSIWAQRNEDLNEFNQNLFKADRSECDIKIMWLYSDPPDDTRIKSVYNGNNVTYIGLRHTGRQLYKIG